MKNLKIIYEGEGFVAVEKPAGLLVYLPKNHKEEETVVSLLQDTIEHGNGRGREGIVHRLDRDTSGILLVAKNLDAEIALKKVFKERGINKSYKALVWGKVEPKEGEIDIPLGRGSKDRLRVVPKEGGRKSITKYKVEKYFQSNDVSYLSVRLITGRTHQVRVHFSSIGHPVVGDEKYSKKKTELRRQFLHASKLEFKDPVSGKDLLLESELPSDLSEFIKNLS